MTPPPPGALDRALLVGGVLQLIVLLLMSWHADGPAPTHGGAPGRTAVQGPGGGAAIVAVVLILLAVAWLAVSTLPPRPPVPRPAGAVLLALTVSALAFVLVKLSRDVDGLTRFAWVGLALATGLAVCGVVAARSAGRVSQPS